MVDIPQDELLDKAGSVYKLVILAARRAIELSDGAQKLVQTKQTKPTMIALEEIRQGKVSYKLKEKQK